MDRATGDAHETPGLMSVSVPVSFSSALISLSTKSSLSNTPARMPVIGLERRRALQSLGSVLTPQAALIQSTLVGIPTTTHEDAGSHTQPPAPRPSPCSTTLVRSPSRPTCADAIAAPLDARPSLCPSPPYSGLSTPDSRRSATLSVVVPLFCPPPRTRPTRTAPNAPRSHRPERTRLALSASATPRPRDVHGCDAFTFTRPARAPAPLPATFPQPCVYGAR